MPPSLSQNPLFFFFFSKKRKIVKSIFRPLSDLKINFWGSDDTPRHFLWYSEKEKKNCQSDTLTPFWPFENSPLGAPGRALFNAYCLWCDFVANAFFFVGLQNRLGGSKTDWGVFPEYFGVVLRRVWPITAWPVSKTRPKAKWNNIDQYCSILKHISKRVVSFETTLHGDLPGRKTGQTTQNNAENT